MNIGYHVYIVESEEVCWVILHVPEREWMGALATSIWLGVSWWESNKVVRWVAPKWTNSVEVGRDPLNLDWVEDTKAKVFLLLDNWHPFCPHDQTHFSSMLHTVLPTFSLFGGMCTRVNAGSHPHSSSLHLVKMVISPQVWSSNGRAGHKNEIKKNQQGAEEKMWSGSAYRGIAVQLELASLLHPKKKKSQLAKWITKKTCFETSLLDRSLKMAPKDIHWSIEWRKKTRPQLWVTK